VVLAACPDCDLLQRVPDLPPGGQAACPRCGHVVASRAVDPFDRPLALTVAALIVLVVANVTQMMEMSAVGRHSSTTIIGGCVAMWRNGEPVTAMVVAFCAVFAPAACLLLALAVLLAVRRPPAPAWTGELLRWARALRPWSMVEVMMLGILVALVKIAELARVEPGIGMFAIFALMILMPMISASFDEKEFWHRIRWADGKAPLTPQSPVEATR
jgi:paraquat-inducible protein A